MSFKFINEDYTGFTAQDAGSVGDDELTCSGMFVEQEKILSFRLGNTGSSETNFAVTSSGVNADVLSDVSFSLDGEDFTPSLTVSGIAPNHVTDIIKCKFAPDAGDVLGVGSFLIRVDEE